MIQLHIRSGSRTKKSDS